MLMSSKGLRHQNFVGGVILFLVGLVILQFLLFHAYVLETDSIEFSHRQGGSAGASISDLPLPFQGIYMCRNVLESYGAAWLTTTFNFLQISQHPYKTAMRQQAFNWTLGQVRWGQPDSMEVGSELVLKGPGGALRSLDVLEFAVEHLSGYSKLLRHDQKQNAATDWKTQEIVRIIQGRIRRLQKAQQEQQNDKATSSFADKILVVLPFHAATGAAIFGGINTKSRGLTGTAYTVTRNLFFHATLTSLKGFSNQIAVFVENIQDYEYCQSLQDQGIFQFYEINQLQDVPDNRFLPEATVYEVERRLIQGHYNNRSIEYIYFSEADQILKWRHSQLADLLDAARASQEHPPRLMRKQAVLTPHRLAPIPHPDDFQHDATIASQVVQAVGTSLKKFGASKYWEMKKKPVIEWKDTDDDGMASPFFRCCMDPRDDGTDLQHPQWVPFMTSPNQDEDHALTTSRFPMTLLNVGPYHVVNGDADLWSWKWRICNMEWNRECSTRRLVVEETK